MARGFLASMGEDVAIGALEMLAIGAGAWLLFGGRGPVPLAPAGLTPPLPPGAYLSNVVERQALLSAGEIVPGWIVYVVPDAVWPNPIEIGAIPTAGAWMVRESMVESLLGSEPMFAPDPPPTQAWGPTPTPTPAAAVDWSMIAGLG